jgi:uncharacterized membrane protein
MTWRGSTTAADKAFASLPYLLPLLDALIVGQSFFAFTGQFPALLPFQAALVLLVTPVTFVYGLIPGGFGSLVVFFLLIFLVVRNPNISHFIRFNTLQAILLGFIIFVCSLLINLLAGVPSLELLTDTLSNVVFLGGIASVGYSIVQSLRGQYAEIPTISEAVYMQVR